MNKITFQLGFVVAVAAIAAGCSTMVHEEVNVPWDSVPAVVQSTIQAHQYGGTVVGKIEKETNECGVVYEAKVKGPNGECSEVKVAESGKLLKYKAGKATCTK